MLLIGATFGAGLVPSRPSCSASRLSEFDVTARLFDPSRTRAEGVLPDRRSTSLRSPRSPVLMTRRPPSFPRTRNRHKSGLNHLARRSWSCPQSHGDVDRARGSYDIPRIPRRDTVPASSPTPMTTSHLCDGGPRHRTVQRLLGHEPHLQHGGRRLHHHRVRRRTMLIVTILKRAACDFHRLWSSRHSLPSLDSLTSWRVGSRRRGPNVSGKSTP